MKRREFIALAGLAALAPHLARAQDARLPTIGVLMLRKTQWQPLEDEFIGGLRDLGYVDGKTIHIEFRSAEGNVALLQPLAEELMRLKVSAIVALFTPVVIAAAKATRETPIVMIETADPVGMGMVASLSRPGGNITGSTGATSETTEKSLELLHEALPAIRRIAVLVNTPDPFSQYFLAHATSAAAQLGLEVAQPAVSGVDLDAAFSTIAGQGVDAVIGQPSLDWTRTSELALRHNLPSVEPNFAYARAGGLLAYSGLIAPRDDAVYVDKILKGAKPADLPVRGPTRFNFVINLKTARALGVTIPPTLLARADEVIE